MLDSDDVQQMAAYIEAADRYFRELDAPRELFAKPFVPRSEAAYNLARLGFLLHHLDHHPPHTVLDFGAGMCWLTSVLLQSGCRVVALDVSPTALRLGSEAVELGHPKLRPGRVRFLTYDGFRIPLEDSSVDRIACYDALHHVPNKRTVLREMYRVLRPAGRVCFAEPGPGHAGSQLARAEAEQWGVLEDEVDAAALCAMAATEGYTWSYIVPLPVVADNEVTPEKYASMRSGSRTGLLDWSGNDGLIVLGKGPRDHRDSRIPGRLNAAVEITACPDSVSPGELFDLTIRVANRGDTEWLALPSEVRSDRLDYGAVFLGNVEHPSDGAASVAEYRRYIERNAFEGFVTVGAKLFAVPGGEFINLDYGRGFFARNVVPNTSTSISMQLRAPETQGLFRVTVDPVSEYVTWFGDAGSTVVHRYLRVGEPQWADSRAPNVLAGRVRIVDSSSLARVKIALDNTGDTIWLAHPIAEGGWVQVGLQAESADGRRERDWRRVQLPRDVGPGESVELSCDLSGAQGTFALAQVYLVSELRKWFADEEPETSTVKLG